MASNIVNMLKDIYNKNKPSIEVAKEISTNKEEQFGKYKLMNN